MSILGFTCETVETKAFNVLFIRVRDSSTIESLAASFCIALQSINGNCGDTK